MAWGMTANASEAASAPVRCEPWPSVGVASSTPSAARVSAEVSSVVRPSAGAAATARRTGTNAGAALGFALQAPQRRTDEEQEAGDGGERVAGQPEHEQVVAPAEPQRLARLEPDAPEVLLHAGVLERRLDVVVRADRHAAGDEQDIAARRGLDGGARRLAVVGHDRVQHDLGAGGLGEQSQGEPVGLVDPAGRGRRTDLEQLAARGEHVHDRAPVHGDLADARGGERRDALHGQRRAGRGEHVTARDVLAAVADVEAVRQRPGRRHRCRPPPSRPRRAGSRQHPRAAPRPW